MKSFHKIKFTNAILILFVGMLNPLLVRALKWDVEAGQNSKTILIDGKEPVDWVDPLIGTATSRWIYFSSACRPFGMVNLSPDTDIKGAWNSGYLYDTRSIRCFSHIHAWQMAGIPVMPTTGAFKGHLGSDVYRSKFSHDKEIVQPGYHSVYLEDYNIRVELTSTMRVGFHRYTYSGSGTSYILFDLGSPLGPTDMKDASARVVNDKEIAGYALMDRTRRRPKPTYVFFVARFNKPFSKFGGWKEGKILRHIKEISGKRSGVFVKYSVKKDEQILLKVAISYVSEEQARLNLETELPHWDFDRVRRESRDEWNKWLSKIEVHGGTDAQKTKFYTDLWHALLGRRVVSDVDGKYCDMTGSERRIRQIPIGPDGKPDHCFYNSDSFWGAQWTINVLWGLAYPEMVSEFCKSFLDMYDNGGLIPRGPSGGNYTFVMTAASSTPLFVSAYMKGIRDFDVEKAYQGIRKNAFPGGLMSKAGYEHDTAVGGGVEYYIKRGYIPLGIKARAYHVSGAGQTLEYAFDDWCVAQMAKALGKDEDYQLFMKRAQNYKNIFDPSTGFMRPKNMDGSWLEPFDPFDKKGWVEANAWQATWYVPHDVQGLINLMGGREKFIEKLNFAFEKAARHNFVSSHGKYADYLNYGNQPATQVAHLFNYAGAPWLTQKWVREVKEKTFGGITPYDGYYDDEDQGLMGALSALMAMGLFEMRGGCAIDPIYEISSPIFDKIVIHLDQKYYPGKEFVIETLNNSPENIYIQSAKLDGKSLNKPWFFHRELVDGGKLEIVLSPNPNTAWGSRPEDAPPSMTPVR